MNNSLIKTYNIELINQLLNEAHAKLVIARQLLKNMPVVNSLSPQDILLVTRIEARLNSIKKEEQHLRDIS